MLLVIKLYEIIFSIALKKCIICLESDEYIKNIGYIML